MSSMNVGYLEIRCPVHYGKHRKIEAAGETDQAPFVRLDCGCTWRRREDGRWETPTDEVEYGLRERMVERYGEVVGLELAGKIAKMQEVLENADNMRVAEVGNIMEEARYRVRKESGCCGFFDKTIRVHGREFCVGFNHGH